MSIDLTKPLDSESAEGREFLKGLQGNILKSHARDHAMHLFVCFGMPTDESGHAECVKGARQWIGAMAASHVTSAAAQRDDVGKQHLFTMLLLSNAGYEFLGEHEHRPRDGGFRDGMRDRRSQLDDPRFEQWEPKYQIDEEKIHALVIVATEKADASAAVAELDAMKTLIEGQLAAFGGSILVDERGFQKRDAAGRAIENFGYADGVSQPQFIEGSAARAERYDQRIPLKLVLEQDRHGGGYGSYLVYRKLEQNVASFEAAVARVASELGEHPELVGAMVIGRFKNGTPLTTHGSLKAGYRPVNDEDFNYDDDRRGNRCPLHAHIRKVNPRESLGFITDLFAQEATRRIARRGITYEDAKNGTVGLIFMCCQRDIKDQFEFIQRRWANSSNFSKPGTGLDPVIGQAPGAHDRSDSPNWPTGYDSDGRKRIRFDEHVRLLGGEYFFAPSIAGLGALATPR